MNNVTLIITLAYFGGIIFNTWMSNRAAYRMNAGWTDLTKKLIDTWGTQSHEYQSTVESLDHENELLIAERAELKTLLDTSEIRNVALKREVAELKASRSQAQ